MCLFTAKIKKAVNILLARVPKFRSTVLKIECRVDAPRLTKLTMYIRRQLRFAEASALFAYP